MKAVPLQKIKLVGVRAISAAAFEPIQIASDSKCRPKNKARTFFLTWRKIAPAAIKNMIARNAAV